MKMAILLVLAPLLVSSNEPYPIVAFGDSITWGAYVTNHVPEHDGAVDGSHLTQPDETTYPADLSRLLGKPVLNYGYSGETTWEGLPRFRRMLALHPSTVLIMEGINDLWRGGTVSGVVTNLAAMVTATRQAGAVPVLLTEPPAFFARNNPLFLLDAGSRQLHHRVIALGVRLHVPVVDVFSTLSWGNGALTRQQDGREDGLHPNEVGYALLAVAVTERLDDPVQNAH